MQGALPSVLWASLPYHRFVHGRPTVLLSSRVKECVCLSVLALALDRILPLKSCRPFIWQNTEKTAYEKQRWQRTRWYSALTLNTPVKRSVHILYVPQFWSVLFKWKIFTQMTQSLTAGNGLCVYGGLVHQSSLCCPRCFDIRWWHIYTIFDLNFGLVLFIHFRERYKPSHQYHF